MKLTLPPSWLIVLFLGLWLFSLLLNISLVPVHLEESRRGFIALEMWFKGNLLVPTQLGEHYYRKPPLFNWLALLSFQLFGVNAFALRILSVLSLAGIGLVHYLVSRRYVAREVALYSTFFLLVAVDWYFYFATLGEIDLFYALLTYSAFLLFFHFLRRKAYLWMFVVPYTLHALGLLTKGLPSVAFLGITTLAVLIYERRWRLLFSWQHLAGGLMFLLVAGSYFYLYSRYNDPLGFWAELWSESGDRTMLGNTLGDLGRHLLFFLLDTVKNILPAALLLPFVIKRDVLRNIRENPFTTFCLLVFFVNFLLYWVSPGARARYIYMLYPFLILLILYLYHRASVSGSLAADALRITMLVVVLLLAATSVAVPFLPLVEDKSKLAWMAPMFVVLFTELIFDYFRRPRYRVLLFLFALVLGRLLFDLTVLPAQAREQPALQAVAMAEQLHEAAGSEDLYLTPSLGEGQFPFNTVFYLVKARRQPLEKRQTSDCSALFIARPSDLRQRAYNELGVYEWKNNSYFLVRFTDCE